MGFVDRGGGRESKGGSLRRSTKNPGAAAARLARAVKAAPVAAGPSPPPPPLAKPSPELGIDFGVALLSRLLDASREGMWDRAHAEGQCAAAVIWSSEMAKQEEVLRVCSERPGVIYAAVGVHPDNIDRTNKRSQDTWLESLEALARTPACVALLSGLNLQRDHATHYFQESLLQATAALAVKLDLPLMLHVSSDAETIERTVSLLQELVQESKLAVLIHNIVTVCGGAPKTAELLANAGFYASVSAAGLATEAELAVAVPVLSAFPMERFVIGTNSPWNTPQNIPDEHLRELANEPCNLQYVINAVASALGIATGDANATAEEGEAEVAKSTTTLAEFKERLRATSLELMGFMKVRAPAATAEEAQAALEKREAEDEDDEDSDESPQEEDAKAANETSAKTEAEEETLRAVPIRNAKAATVFSCVKCRAELFNQLALVTHPVGARAAVFESKAKKQTHGSCAAALFVDMSSAETDDALGVLRASSAPGISIAANMDVSCATCKCKIGGAQQEAACPCGLVVPGLTARIVASRVDMITTDASQDDILARAAAEQARRAEAGDTASDSDDDRPNKAKEAKKNVKQQNRSNMSNFRNKNWTPGMAKVADDVVAEQSLGKGGKGGAKRKKGQRRGDSDSD